MADNDTLSNLDTAALEGLDESIRRELEQRDAEHRDAAQHAPPAAELEPEAEAEAPPIPVPPPMRESAHEDGEARVRPELPTGDGDRHETLLDVLHETPDGQLVKTTDAGTFVLAK